MQEPDGRYESRRDGIGSGRVLKNFEIPEGIEFPENFEILYVSKSCIIAYKICIYTVQFLPPVKLLGTRILRILWPDVYNTVWLRAQYIVYAVEQYRWEIREVQTYIWKSVWIQ